MLGKHRFLAQLKRRSCCHLRGHTGGFIFSCDTGIPSTWIPCTLSVCSVGKVHRNTAGTASFTRVYQIVMTAVHNTKLSYQCSRVCNIVLVQQASSPHSTLGLLSVALFNHLFVRSSPLHVALGRVANNAEPTHCNVVTWRAGCTTVENHSAQGQHGKESGGRHKLCQWCTVMEHWPECAAP